MILSISTKNGDAWCFVGHLLQFDLGWCAGVTSDGATVVRWRLIWSNLQTPASSAPTMDSAVGLHQHQHQHQMTVRARKRRKAQIIGGAIKQAIIGDTEAEAIND